MTHLQILAAGLFALAIAHTFSTRFFERMAHRRPAHAGAWHLLGEVEVVFGFWAAVLVFAIVAFEGRTSATAYLDGRDFTEPLFVFAIMVVAGSRPILHLARSSVERAAALLPARGATGFYAVSLSLVPLMGSFITEPAAITLAAMMLRDRIFGGAPVSRPLQYATIGVLFVNVSIGGTLTPFAAPPVLMVAGTWHWDLAHMLTHFGWRAALAVLVNTVAVTTLFRAELSRLEAPPAAPSTPPPRWVTLLHLLFLGGIVAFAHHPPIFLGVLMLFLGVATAYPQHQDRLILREGLMVAFFLAGLVVLGGQQRWWLEPLLRSLSTDAAYWGAVALTAVTDNAALTYLASLVHGLDEDFKHAIVAGAVTGGGLTVIANAPNPAGFAILRDRFEDGAINPWWLLVAALPPTLVAAAAFRWI